MSFLPMEILIHIFSHIQFEKDIKQFQMVCHQWYQVATSDWAREKRWNNLYECSIQKCCQPGNYHCEKCETKELLCSHHAVIRCIFCYKGLGPKCCVSNVPVCIECIKTCGVCRTSSNSVDPFTGCRTIPGTFYDDVLGGHQITGKIFFYCNTCEHIGCCRCLSSCFKNFHEYFSVSKDFQMQFTNLKY